MNTQHYANTCDIKTIAYRRCILLSCFLIIGYLVIGLYLTSASPWIPTYIHSESKNINNNNNNRKWIITTSGDLHKFNTWNESSQWSILTIQPTPSSNRCGIYPDSTLQKTTLKAVNLGARFIYLTSLVDARTPQLIQRCNTEKQMWGLKYTGSLPDPISSHFNGISHMTKVDRVKSFSYELGLWITSPVQKVLQAGEVRAPGRPVAPDERAPPISLSHSRSFAFIKDEIMFSYDAFWSIIPIKDNMLWSIWVQRLLQEIGSWVTFVTASKHQRSCTSDQAASRKMSIQLASWQCLNRSCLFECVRSLNRFMMRTKMLNKDEVNDIEKWLDALVNLGYKQPSLVVKTSLPVSLENVHRVLFYPSIHESKDNTSMSLFCNKSIPKCPVSTVETSRNKISNIILIIVFNWSTYYQIVSYLERLYRPLFSQIVFCGMDIQNYFKHFKALNIPVSFVEMPSSFDRGYQGYLCVEAVMKMNYGVDGYLHVSDDVLLNVWNLPMHHTDKPWFQQSLKMANLTQPKVPDIWRNPKGWWPWPSKIGRIPLMNTINLIRSLQKESAICDSFIKRLSEYGEDKGFYEASDIFYIPQTLSKQYLYLITYFKLNKIFLEIAIPTIISGLVKADDIIRLQGSYLWFRDRGLYRQRFNTSHVYLHAFKIGPCFNKNNNACKGFLCDQYLPCIVS